MSCQYFIQKKNRYCLNKAMKNHSYCYSHAKLSKKQSGGAAQQPSRINDQYISPYALISSELPPDPQQQSWYHYQAPVYQSFGDYVCIKKSFLNNAKDLLNEVFTERKVFTK